MAGRENARPFFFRNRFVPKHVGITPASLVQPTAARRLRPAIVAMRHCNRTDPEIIEA
jgi:hypothetical protein